MLLLPIVVACLSVVSAPKGSHSLPFLACRTPYVHLLFEAAASIAPQKPAHVRNRKRLDAL